LLTLGFIRIKQVDVHGDGSRLEWDYLITDAGRAALATAQK